jgi:nitroreductase
MMIKDLILKNRSYRRFHEEYKIKLSTLKELINLARLSASGANRQPLKYIISSDSATNKKIFPYLAWAGYLKDWDGPMEGERPSGYIIILGDKNISPSFGCDHGIAAQSILLGAAEEGLGGCMIGSIERNNLRNAFNISDNFEILLVIALGKPKEEIILEEMESNGDIKYYRDNKTIHHVPKRKLQDVIIRQY